jgi:hypothetical protein
VEDDRVRTRMPFIRNVAILGIAKKVYDESRKPENQKRINDAMASLKARRAARRRPPR